MRSLTRNHGTTNYPLLWPNLFQTCSDQINPSFEVLDTALTFIYSSRISCDFSEDPFCFGSGMTAKWRPWRVFIKHRRLSRPWFFMFSASRQQRTCAALTCSRASLARRNLSNTSRSSTPFELHDPSSFPMWADASKFIDWPKLKATNTSYRLVCCHVRHRS